MAKAKSPSEYLNQVKIELQGTLSLDEWLEWLDELKTATEIEVEIVRKYIERET